MLTFTLGVIPTASLGTFTGTGVLMLRIPSLCTAFEHDASDDSLGGEVFLFGHLRGEIHGTTLLTTTELALPPFTMSVGKGFFDESAGTGVAYPFVSLSTLPQFDSDLTSVGFGVVLNFEFTNPTVFAGAISGVIVGVGSGGSTFFSASAGSNPFEATVNNCTT